MEEQQKLRFEDLPDAIGRILVQLEQLQ